ncbi:MAG: DNA-binding protein [Symploca sp. SIO1B1]|nr:DNA-binding protein [Symploca sp. SIO1B1]
MVAITINIPDNRFKKLQDLANVYGVAPEALLRASIKDWLSSQKSEFSDAADYVLKKNTELYRRLA